MQTLKLKNEFKIGGVTITEISYDVQNFTGDDYLAATDETDSSKPLRFAFMLAAHIVLASNRGKGWTPADFRSLRGVDVVRFASIGNDFFSQAAEEQPADNSDAPTDSTPSDSTPPSES